MPQALRYTPLEKIEIPRPVDRIATLKRACAGKVVLDLGAMDETAFRSKCGQGVWLHEELAKTARQVIGVDSSSLVPEGGMQTAANASIQRGDILDLSAFVEALPIIPEIVVAGELIEHLENPLEFLRSFRTIAPLKGKRLLFTTPNATALHNGLIAFCSRESTHHDHLSIQSFKTLSTLMTRAGYEDWTLTPYHSDFVEMKLRNRAVRRGLVVAGETGIRLMERAFPLLSFGLICETTI